MWIKITVAKPNNFILLIYDAVNWYCIFLLLIRFLKYFNYILPFRILWTIVVLIIVFNYESHDSNHMYCCFQWILFIISIIIFILYSDYETTKHYWHTTFRSDRTARAIFIYFIIQLYIDFYLMFDLLSYACTGKS